MLIRRILIHFKLAIQILTDLCSLLFGTYHSYWVPVYEVSSNFIFPIPECPEEVSPFLGSPGLMVAGSMTPALEGVLITIATEQDGQLTTTTDNKGQYRSALYFSLRN